jgi:hypothetical protein
MTTHRAPFVSVKSQTCTVFAQANGRTQLPSANLIPPFLGLLVSGNPSSAAALHSRCLLRKRLLLVHDLGLTPRLKRERGLRSSGTLPGKAPLILDDNECLQPSPFASRPFGFYTTTFVMFRPLVACGVVGDHLTQRCQPCAAVCLW